VSRVLVGLLILAAVAVGAYLASRFLFGKTETPETSAEQTPAKPVTPPPEPPPPPPPPPPVTAKVAMETPPVDELKADHAGVIETILADKSTVKAGDVIAKLVGDKPIEAELASIGRDVKRLTDQIDAANQKLSAAQAAGNKNSETAVTAQLETLKKSLATKHDLQATKTTDLDKFLMHAPTAGTFTPAVKLGKKIAANDVVATIQRDPKPVATFKVPDAKPFTANASVDLGFATNDQHVTCVVAEVQEGSIKVACPSDPALVEGADVTLKTNMAQPAPSDPAPPAAPPAAGSDGSAAAGSSGTAPLPTTAPTAPAPPSPSPGP
jgi:biotin carboxyl carrier protein